MYTLFIETNGIQNGVQNGIRNGIQNGFEEEMNGISNGWHDNEPSKLKAAVRHGRKTTSTADGPKVDFLESLAAMVIQEGIVDAMSREK